MLCLPTLQLLLHVSRLDVVTLALKHFRRRLGWPLGLVTIMQFGNVVTNLLVPCLTLTLPFVFPLHYPLRKPYLRSARFTWTRHEVHHRATASRKIRHHYSNDGGLGWVHVG